jgi:hypothetical protein
MAEQPVPGSETSEADLQTQLAERFFGDDQPDEQLESTEDAEQTGEEQSQEQEAKEPPPDESVEVEYEGATYRVPKELKDAVLRWGDYTRKTQDLAERAKIVDSQLRMQQERDQFAADSAQEHQAIMQLDAAIQSYQRMDWSNMGTEEILKHKLYLDQLKDQKGQVEEALKAKFQQFQQKQMQHFSQIKQSGEEMLRKSLPKWDADTKKSLLSYGVQEGYLDHELQAIVDPRMLKTLWKASQWDALQSQKGLAAQRAQAAPPVLKPGASNPEINQRMERLNFRKQVKSAKSSQDKAKLIQSRLEKLFT